MNLSTIPHDVSLQYSNNFKYNIQYIKTKLFLYILHSSLRLKNQGIPRLLSCIPLFITAIELCNSYYILQVVYNSRFNSPILDLCILAACNHSIISSGSYSWWAGWLAS